MKTGPNAFSRCAPVLIRIVRSHPRLFMAAVLGLLVIALDPARARASARLLLGWDVGVVFYLLAVYTMMARANLSGLRLRAAREDPAGKCGSSLMGEFTERRSPSPRTKGTRAATIVPRGNSGLGFPCLKF